MLRRSILGICALLAITLAVPAAHAGATYIVYRVEGEPPSTNCEIGGEDPCWIEAGSAGAGVVVWQESNGKEDLQTEPTCDDASTPEDGSCADGSAPRPADTRVGGVEVSCGPTGPPTCTH